MFLGVGFIDTPLAARSWGWLRLGVSPLLGEGEVDWRLEACVHWPWLAHLCYNLIDIYRGSDVELLVQDAQPGLLPWSWGFSRRARHR